VAPSLGLLVAAVLSAMSAVSLGSPACADEPGIIYAVAYVEVAASAATEARALLQAFRDASRREEGNVRFEALHRSERTNHFAIVEAWKSRTAHEAHARSAATSEFRTKLKGLLSAPYDERLHLGLAVEPLPTVARPGTIWVLTHVDVIPTFKDPGVVIVKELAVASRQDPGNLGFDALTQSNRANHMTLVEVWADRRVFEQHIVAPHVKKFREALGPMSGSLYDERLYTPND
jgi:quinol monooxygenase YgiN